MSPFNPLKSNFYYKDLVTGFVGEKIATLISKRPDRRYRIHKKTVDQWLNHLDTWPLTVVENIVKLDAMADGTRTDIGPISLAECLAEYFEAKLKNEKKVFIALSGGIDSQLLAIFLKSRGFNLNAVSIKTGIPNYCEWSHISAFAKKFEIPLIGIECSGSDFVDALDTFLGITETPIYNLHAISKWILAKEARKLGINRLITGDGADQIMRGQKECDLFPLTQNVFRNAGVELLAPFTSEATDIFVKQNGPWENKQPIYLLAEKMGLPKISKVPSYFPNLPDFESSHACMQASLRLLRKIFTLEGGQECVESPELSVQNI
jgi:7-cyano-7-deazaguanine synthase in queuosine biosynthesis